MTLPPKCGLNQISKRKVMTDDFDSISALIHSTRAKRDFNTLMHLNLFEDNVSF